MTKKVLGIAILAAGSSSRMGRPKQLLPIDGLPLLQKTVNAARTFASSYNDSASSAQIFVVLGANSDAIEQAVDLSDCQVVKNPHWSSGMAGSIKCALGALQAQSAEPAGLLICMADQPFVSAELLAELVAAFDPPQLSIVLSAYSLRGSGEKISGPPALFDRSLFSEIAALSGDQGARKIAQIHQEQTGQIDFALGSIDIDTESDYTALLAAI